VTKEQAHEHIIQRGFDFLADPGQYDVIELKLVRNVRRTGRQQQRLAAAGR
jgi:hypothetical protein